LNNSPEKNIISIRYLPNGEIDRTRTSNASLSSANDLLAPAITRIRMTAQRQGIDLDFWKRMNWFLVSYYWGFLGSLGQLQPTLYPSLPNRQGPGPYPVDLVSAQSYDSSNNIFVNATLFDIYSAYLSDTILPLFGLPSLKFAPLTEESRMQPTQVTFLRAYMCQQRQPKEPFTAIFSVLTTIYVFTAGPLQFIILIATYLQTRRNEKGIWHIPGTGYVDK
jgi:hypothetical protein